MDKSKREVNIQIGKRLREIRSNLRCRQSEFADLLGVSEEHYRKYESGVTGLSADKMLILYKMYHIDPTYLITGDCMKDFDVDYYIANCNKEQRAVLLERVIAYMSELIRK